MKGEGARRPWLKQDGVAWLAVALLLALPALALGWTDLARPDALHAAWLWQRERLASQPWRLFSSAWVHGGAIHLGANLLGALLVAGLGWSARAPARSALAWLAAWPLTQLGLLLDPQLRFYGGASGVLHAGCAVVAVHLLVDRVGPAAAACLRGSRTIGLGLLAMLLVKVALEAPWQHSVIERAPLDVLVVPLAHASGVASGVAGALLAAGIAGSASAGRRRPPQRRS